MKSSKLLRVLSSSFTDTYLHFLLRRCVRKPRLSLTLARMFGRIAVRMLCALMMRAVNGLYPDLSYRYRARKDILKSARRIQSIPLEKAAFSALPELPINGSADGPLSAPVRIRLASHNTAFSEDLYDRSFVDEEDRMAVHRFVWMLVLLDQQPSRDCISFCLRQMAYWCAKYPEVTDDLPFSAYSVSERLVAWLYCLMLAKKIVPFDDEFISCLSVSFQKQLLALATRLEYHRTQTNNHILNNARALYICGILLKIPAIAALGRQILYRETDSFIVDGELMEDSSHYQMLLTKSYLEIYQCATLKRDEELISWITPRLKRMLSVCSLLQSGSNTSEFPLFGDISPDSDPDWLTGYPFSASAGHRSPWHRLINIDCAHLLARSEATNPTGRRDDFIHNRTWHAIRGNGLEVWAIGKSGIRCHGHNDNGSIVVFFQGRPCIVDLGLSTYRRDDETARKQQGGEGHNAPFLDGMPPDIDRWSLYHSDLVASSYTVQHVDDVSVRYEIDYLRGSATLTRKITLEQADLVIEDSASSERIPCSYTSHWHIPAAPTEVRASGTEAAITFETGMKLLVRDSSHALRVETTSGSRASRYGGAERVTTIVINTVASKNSSLLLRFSFGVPA